MFTESTIFWKMGMLSDVSQGLKSLWIFQRVQNRYVGYCDSIDKHGLRDTWMYNPRNGRLITIEYICTFEK